MTDDNPHPARIPVVPPGSSVLRELCHAVSDTLALPRPATERDEVTYLRILRDRSRLVRQVLRRVLADRELGDLDIMIAVASLRDQAAQLPDDSYDHAPEPS